MSQNLTEAQERALAAIKESGHVAYTFDDWKTDGDQITNVEEAKKYRVNGISAQVIEELIELGSIRAVAYSVKHGRLYPVEEDE